MNEKLKIGDTIQLTPSEVSVIEGFAEKVKGCYKLLEMVAELRQNARDGMMNFIRGSHPELEDYDFVVSHKENVVTILSRKDSHPTR